MYLKRIAIPKFRALKGVDMTFDDCLSPQVFPIGAANGGGKSTLLQFIFILLHCSVSKDRKRYLANMMSSFRHPPKEGKVLVAELELRHEGADVLLQ